MNESDDDILALPNVNLLAVYGPCCMRGYDTNCLGILILLLTIADILTNSTTHLASIG